MEQVSQYVSGERDYTKIEGGTGPLVYPAAHVYIYTGLYYLTGEGRDIFLAQQLFAILYMATLVVVMACYWQAKASSPRYRTPKAVIEADILAIAAGPAVRFPTPDTLQATTQYLRPPLLQRLLRRLLPMARHLLPAAAVLGARRIGIQLGIGHKDVATTGPTGRGDHLIPGEGLRSQLAARAPDGAGAGGDRLAVLAGQCVGIHGSRL